MAVNIKKTWLIVKLANLHTVKDYDLIVAVYQFCPLTGRYCLAIGVHDGFYITILESQYSRFVCDTMEEIQAKIDNMFATSDQHGKMIALMDYLRIKNHADN